MTYNPETGELIRPGTNIDATSKFTTKEKFDQTTGERYVVYVDADGREHRRNPNPDTREKLSYLVEDLREGFITPADVFQFLLDDVAKSYRPTDTATSGDGPE